MKKFLISIFILMAAILIVGCNYQSPKSNVNSISTPTSTSTSISYFISTEDYLKYCNGADMNGDGYKATITKQVIEEVPPFTSTPSILANKTLELAAAAANITYPQSNQNADSYVKVIGDTAYLEPTEGWAGVSIFLCYWRPFVEVNLLQIPGIKNVVWVSDPAQWQNLK